MSELEKLVDQFHDFVKRWSEGVCPSGCLPTVQQHRDAMLLARIVTTLTRRPDREDARTDLENAPSPCLGWCAFGVGGKEAEWRMIWHTPWANGWSAHGCVQDVRAWLPLPAPLAQRIEHEPSKLGVEGSNPSGRANLEQQSPGSDK